MSALVHRDPLSAWRHLCTLGGLELEGRDEGLDQRILSRLAPQADSIQQALASADMGSFIRAFFEALHPYVAMFRDILDFFEHADATRGESQWTLQVDDIDLGLEHFRQWLAVWDGFAKTGIAVPAIDAKACWELWRVLQNRQTVQDEIKSHSNTTSSTFRMTFCNGCGLTNKEPICPCRSPLIHHNVLLCWPRARP